MNLFDEIEKLNIQGPTVKEYFESLSVKRTFKLESDEVIETTPQSELYKVGLIRNEKGEITELKNMTQKEKLREEFDRQFHYDILFNVSKEDKDKIFDWFWQILVKTAKLNRHPLA